MNEKMYVVVYGDSRDIEINELAYSNEGAWRKWFGDSPYFHGKEDQHVKNGWHVIPVQVTIKEIVT